MICERMKSQWILRQCVWKLVIFMGCACIATIAMQYMYIGAYYASYPSARQAALLQLGKYSLDEMNQIFQDRMLPANSNYTNTVLPVKDDVFLDWQENSKTQLAVFLFSAINTNTTLVGYKNVLKLNGWEAYKHSRYKFKCCVLWKNDEISAVPSPNRTYWKKQVLAATQYSCPLRGSGSDVKAVTLEFMRKSCPTNRTNYVKVFTPRKHKKDSYAICAKIIYGELDYKLLIDWVEYYRAMKIDKILLYAYKVNGTALRVLRHYSREGFVDVRRFNFPWKTGHLKRDVGVKNNNAWQDEQVVVFDCFERLRGYSYVSIVDLDEFIVPKLKDDLKSMMSGLRSRFKNAAGFTFKSAMFVKNWGKIVVNNGSDIVQYYNRTKPILTRFKNAMIMDRVQDGSISTHMFKAKEGYNRMVVPEKIAVIHHYRFCYQNFNNTCVNGTRHTDHSIDKYVNLIQNRTTELVKLLRVPEHNRP